jgi:hypothetical protein
LRGRPGEKFCNYVGDETRRNISAILIPFPTFPQPTNSSSPLKTSKNFHENSICFTLRFQLIDAMRRAREETRREIDRTKTRSEFPKVNNQTHVAMFLLLAPVFYTCLHRIRTFNKPEEINNDINKASNGPNVKLTTKTERFVSLRN